MTIQSPPSQELTLPVVGMTCASCVNRIERYLARADGVSDATVNLATERATVRFDPSLIDRTGIVAAIEAAGYEVRPEAAAGASAVDAHEAARAAERHELLGQALASLAIGAAMMAVMFWPGGVPWPMMDVNRWMLVPATIVQFVFGRRFLLAAARGARHGEATMDTLVAIGTLPAYGYSLMHELEMAPMVKDPVCGMEVNPEIASAQGLTSEHEGQTYYFCGKGCKLDFDEDPAAVFAPGYRPHM